MTAPASPSSPLRLAIIGAGNMAHRHARAFLELRPRCELAAVVDVSADRARSFAAEFGIPHAYTTVEALLAAGGCDAVSIVTPDAQHAPLSIQCLRAGLHVLCEKPLALSHEEACGMVAVAAETGRINFVNLTYRNWPALQGIAAAVRGGEIGEVRHVEASYAQCWLSSTIWGDWRTSPMWLWRLSSAHGSSGVLGDLGVHVVDFACFPVGEIAEVYCRLQTFAKAPDDRVGEYRLDANDSALITATFANGALGTLHMTRWATGHADRRYLKIHGTRGAVEMDSDRGTDRYRLCAGTDVDRAEWREVVVPPTPTNYERFLTSILSGKQDQPDFARGAAVQRVLDACFASHRANAPVRL